PGYVPDLGARGAQRASLPADQIDLAAVDLAQQLRDVLGDQVNDLELQRLRRRHALALADGLLRPFDVPRPPLRDALHEGGGVVLQLAEHRVLLALLLLRAAPE